jgi:hypothetical protein
MWVLALFICVSSSILMGWYVRGWYDTGDAYDQGYADAISDGEVS